MNNNIFEKNNDNDNIFINNLDNTNNFNIQLKKIIFRAFYIWLKRMIISIVFGLFVLSTMFLIKEDLFEYLSLFLIFSIIFLIVFLKLWYKNYSEFDKKIINNINNLK